MLDTGTLVAVAITLLAFAAGVLVGWLWWGRRFVTTRLTREEALSIVQERIEQDLQQDLQAKDDEIAALRAYVRGERASG